ncbi:bromodomain-containing protein 9-like isoform X3 [Acipenser ruthenus]|uniref:bromodomain-containing protein 9-like isoform X3 n=1 Tax=Acipenser ruthenus TaxID=7906 RepID=UPI0027426A38|nr:bromodomain-containing protein 9-like isoform X3 [Acipenser ruthenus]
MGKKHKKHKSEWRTVDDYVNKPLEKPLKLVLKVGGSEVTELSGSGHDSSYYDDRSDHERERHKEKKKKKKKKSEKEKDKHVGDEERRRRKEEKKRKREREQCDTEGEVEGANAVKKMEEEKKRKQFDAEGEVDDFDRGIKVEQVEHPADRPVRSCRTQQENDCTPIQQLLEHFLRQLQRKDPHGFFAFPVTDAIAPGYSMIIKHPMDFGTIKDKIEINDYKSVTEFKADFKLMCDNAMVYNRPETVYYKAAKKLLHTGFKMMSKERLLALKRSMSFMQNMDFSQQAAILGNEDTVTEEPVPEVIPVPVEPTKKSKKPVKDMNEVISYLYEPEGTACSLTDSTAEEHVLALVEHAADEARDRIHRHLPTSKQDTHRTPNKMQLIKRKIGYLKKDADGALVYTVVNQSDPETEEEETHPVDLSSLSNKLLPGLTTLGFKDDRRNRVTYLNSAYNTQSLQNNTVFPDLRPDEMELLYSAYGDDTGVQCALSLQEFVKGCGNFTKTIVDGLLDQMTGGDHSKAVYQIRQRRNIGMKPPDETKTNLYDMQVGDAAGMAGDSNSSVLDFMSMKSYSDMSLDMSMLNTLGKTVKKEPDHEDGHLHFDDATKLLQDLHEAQNDRVGSRPSSNLSSLSNASERDQHHLGKGSKRTKSPAHLSVGEQAEMVHDPYEFLQSPEPGSTANS